MALTASQLTFSTNHALVTHTCRKTTITQRLHQLLTPDLDHFALYRMAFRLSYGMFPWLMFKRVYTDFKTLRG